MGAAHETATGDDQGDGIVDERRAGGWTSGDSDP